MGVGVWRQDPKTGQWGMSTGTDPNLPVDTTVNQQLPVGMQAGAETLPAGQTFAPTLPAPKTAAQPQTFTNPLDYIADYQNKNAPSQQSAIDLLTNLQSKYGWNRWSDPTYGLSNNETTNNGEEWKVYSEGGNSWYIPGTNEGPSAQSAAQIEMPSTIAPTTSYGAPASSPQTTSPYDSALQQAILSLLQTPQTVDAQSLKDSPENQAFTLGQQRAEERQRAQLAESTAFNGGLNTDGAFDTRLQGIRQKRGEAESQFLGSIAAQKMQDNRDRLTAGIQAATNAGQFQQAQALQLELANLDAAIRRETLAQQGSQFNSSLGFNYTQLQEQANEAATRALLGI